MEPITFILEVIVGNLLRPIVEPYWVAHHTIDYTCETCTKVSGFNAYDIYDIVGSRTKVILSHAHV